MNYTAIDAFIIKKGKIHNFDDNRNASINNNVLGYTRRGANAPIQRNFGILACLHWSLLLPFDHRSHYLLVYRDQHFSSGERYNVKDMRSVKSIYFRWWTNNEVGNVRGG